MSKIEIKDLEVLNLYPKLIPIVKDVMEFSGLNMITSAYRPGDEGVHGQMPVRGIDLRCFDRQTAKIVEENTNEKWVYDPDRPSMQVCIAHDTGQGFHLHLQCHRNTIAWKE